MTTPGSDIERLLSLMAQLRDPDGGCPWDLAQDFSSIAPYTIEEAYEVVDAIDRGDLDDLKDELGDLLLQVVFHAQMASEQGAFGFDDVVRAISDKLVRRHGHVFAHTRAGDAVALAANWDAVKRQERAAKGHTDASALAGIARGLPEWQRAAKLQSRAARTGFDWPGPEPVIAKLREEIAEVEVELARAADDPLRAERLRDEIGDLLFVCIHLARQAQVDAGGALRHANAKFERRFRAMEAIACAQGTSMHALDLQAYQALWEQAKRAESEPGA